MAIAASDVHLSTVKLTTATPTADDVRAALASEASPERARGSQRFFKTGPGEYGEGDVFVGVTVPVQRRIARAFRTLPLAQVLALLQSKVHEERLTALLILVLQFEKGDEDARRTIFEQYLHHARWVNNWDLVDVSAPSIVGAWLMTHDRKVLRVLSKSENVWERRIAIVATWAFIRAGEHRDALAIAEGLLSDSHDLIHKAVGWMLREVGKRASKKELDAFLAKHAARMPRTALRYAIEHYTAPERARWMARASK